MQGKDTAVRLNTGPEIQDKHLQMSVSQEHLAWEISKQRWPGFTHPLSLSVCACVLGQRWIAATEATGGGVKEINTSAKAGAERLNSGA
ncbi:hypothetical protein SKAU_G00078840 [Synaphobranchus kaupii]|uniref:Uncharacterized protein n=1 Tax=Synaphobranchus kaupii TaxID=118154 RepID=A0A9Q1FUG7_SYNKA|nr:hypothetical protein SKAU_G00078840 [Synaphobranchus kaupii]